MATDFRDGKTFPRRGREPIGDALWLARMRDKARASAQGTIFDYIYPYPMDKGVMDRWGITSAEFDAAARDHEEDGALYDWLLTRTTQDRIRSANEWLLNEKAANLDRQDAEEGVRV